MDFSAYNGEVREWIQEVLANRGIDAKLTLEYSNKIIGYGEKTDDNRLMGFGYYYCGETYYGLNDGVNFFEEMSKALFYLNQAEEWELMARCYNFLGIAALSRGNAPIALDYYLNGLNDCQKHELDKLQVIFYVNLGGLYLECGRYEDALESLEQAYGLVEHAPERDATYYAHMITICGNLTQSLVLLNRPQEAYKYLECIHEEYWEYADVIDRQFIYCVEVLYYNYIGDEAKRNVCIRLISETIPDNLTLLDIFYDYYRCCMILLETDQEESFWHIIDVLEPLAQNFKIINLHLKIVSLKIKYYRKHGKNAEYLQETGLYYELSERMEAETRSMVNNVVRLRKNLDLVNRARVKAEQEKQILQERSEIDPLTKIANRFRLNAYSEQVFADAMEKELSLVVEILDIDYFKEFNDNYGHQAGDQCLIQISQIIRTLAEEQHGFCARYGGDEFVIIYEGVGRNQAASLAEELRKRVLEKEIEHRFSKALPVVTVSQGLCFGMPGRGYRMWDFLHAADEMLYKVKRFSRNNYCVGDIKGTENIVLGEEYLENAKGNIWKQSDLKN